MATRKAHSNSNTPEHERDYWRSPPWIVRFAADMWGPLDVDLAADESNHVCEYFYTEWYSALDLNIGIEDWKEVGHRHAWCNPPYSDPLPFVRLAIDMALDGVSVTMLLPCTLGQRWAALTERATERVEFEGRVNFLRPDGTPMDSNRASAMLVHFRGGDLGSTRTTWFNVKDLMRRYA